MKRAEQAAGIWQGQPWLAEVGAAQLASGNAYLNLTALSGRQQNAAGVDCILHLPGGDHQIVGASRPARFPYPSGE